MNGSTNMTQAEHTALHQVCWLLRLTYGIVPIVAGADKFFNYLVDWSIYLNPTIAAKLSLLPSQVMHGVGIIEIVAGALVLFTPYTRWGAYLVAAWLILIAINLFSMGMYYDVAVRDLVMAVGAVALGMLSRNAC